jgi:hypothetical protein
MERGIIKNLFNQKLQESGNNQVKAGKAVVRKLEELLNSDKIKPEDLKFDQLAHDLIPSYDELRTAETRDIALAVSSSQFPVISKVAINKAILDNYELYSEDVGILTSELSATRTNEEYVAGFTDPEAPELRPESMSYEMTNFGDRDITIHMADFGRTISVTREAIFNDRTGQLLDNARLIGEYGGQHRAKMVIQTLEGLPRTAFKEATGASRAFTYKGTTYQNTSIYSNDHSAIDGRVNDNLAATNALADYTDLQAVMDLFTDMTTPTGHEMAVSPKIVLVHEKAVNTAWQILNAPEYLKDPSHAGTAIYHQPNPFGPGGPGGKFNVLSSRYLASTTTWYCGDPAKQLKWLWVWRPATASLAASADIAFFNNIVMTYKFSYHGGVGHADYSYIVKSTA